MGIELFNKVRSHPQPGPWQEGFAATSLMLNSASHGDGNEALKLVIEDTVRAYQRNAPLDIVRFALSQVVEFRKILIDQQARTDGAVTGDITAEILKKKLKGKLPKDYLNNLFK